MEKIIVNPERVRCYGNIMMEHTVDDYTLVGSTILVDTDTVMGAETTVYSIEAESSTISVALVSSVASCSIGDTVTFTATVLDDEEPVEGGTVTFKLNTTTLGSDETDSNGVATYTYTTASVGSLNFTAYYESHNSNTVSVVVSHDYSIAFDSSSYTTSDGNVTAYVTLLDNSNPVSGASISLTGTGSTLSATTNSSGVATFNLTGISSDCTLTCSYDNVSDTATVTVGPSYLFYDDCSTDRRSEYSFISGGSWKTTGSVSYDSTNHCYNITTASSEGMNGLKVNDLTVGNCKITAKLQYNSTNANRQFGIGLLKNTSTFIYARYESNAAGINIVENNATVKTSGTQSLSTNTWYTFELIRNGTTLTMSVYNDSGTLLKSIETSSSILSGTDIPYFYFYGGSKNFKIQEAKVEAL